MSEAKDKKPQAETPAAAKPAAADGEKKLTNKELKELKKQEKLAKRAAAKQSAGIPNQAEEKANANKQKKAQSQQSAAQASQAASQVAKKKPVKKVAIFSHLETKEQRNESGISQAQTPGQVHPAVLSLALKYSSYSIVGSIPRTKAMLETFKKVISQYQTPEGTTLTRNLTSYLSTQIDHIKTARPLSVAMGNAIRWLKQEISVISIDTSDADAKAELVDKIDTFIKEKIEFSDRFIIQQASSHITDGCTILTYGNSNVLRELFLESHKQGKRFTVIIVDSRPLFEGKKLAETLSKEGLKVQYVLITALTSAFRDVDTVFLGAHAMLSNGFLYSRVGTALIAMTAKRANIPVLVCCESIKFSDRVQLDSVTLNELGDADDLATLNNEQTKKPGIALRNFIKTHEDINAAPASNNKQQKGKAAVQEESNIAKDESPLQKWRESDYLNILNIMYDLTPPEYIQKIITEVGALPPSSVPVILREYKAST